MKVVKLDGRKIAKSFHEYFAELFGFPDFYGHNMDAWIDCITYLDEPSAGMSSKIFVQSGESIVFHIDYVNMFKTSNREEYDELIDCIAFVNYRRVENKGTPLIYLSFFDNEHECNSFDESFCTYLEGYLGSVFSKSTDEEIRHFWCDGIAMPSSDQLERKFINDNRRLRTEAWIGREGQTEFEITIKFGKYSLRRFAKGKRLEDCVPEADSCDSIKIDLGARKIELTLL